MSKQCTIEESDYILIKHFLERIKEHNDGILEEFLLVYRDEKESIDENRIHTLSTYIKDIVDLASNKLN